MNFTKCLPKISCGLLFLATLASLTGSVRAKELFTVSGNSDLSRELISVLQDAGEKLQDEGNGKFRISSVVVRCGGSRPASGDPGIDPAQSPNAPFDNYDCNSYANNDFTGQPKAFTEGRHLSDLLQKYGMYESDASNGGFSDYFGPISCEINTAVDEDNGRITCQVNVL